MKTKNAFPPARHRPPAPTRSFPTSPGSGRIQRGKARAHRSSLRHPLITTVKIQDYPALYEYCSAATAGQAGVRRLTKYGWVYLYHKLRMTV